MHKEWEYRKAQLFDEVISANETLNQTASLTIHKQIHSSLFILEQSARGGMFLLLLPIRVLHGYRSFHNHT